MKKNEGEEVRGGRKRELEGERKSMGDGGKERKEGEEGGRGRREREEEVGRLLHSSRH